MVVALQCSVLYPLGTVPLVPSPLVPLLCCFLLALSRTFNNSAFPVLSEGRTLGYSERGAGICSKQLWSPLVTLVERYMHAAIELYHNMDNIQIRKVSVEPIRESSICDIEKDRQGLLRYGMVHVGHGMRLYLSSKPTTSSTAREMISHTFREQC